MDKGMARLSFTIGGQRQSTEFEAENANMAATMFAPVFPNAGAIAVTFKGEMFIYLIKGGQVKELLGAMEVDSG